MLLRPLVLYKVETTSELYGWKDLSQKQYWKLEEAVDTVKRCLEDWPDATFRIIRMVTIHAVVDPTIWDEEDAN